MPRLIAGESYWIWLQAGDDTKYAWGYPSAPGPDIMVPSTARNQGGEWWPVAERETGPIRVDVNVVVPSPGVVSLLGIAGLIAGRRSR